MRASAGGDCGKLASGLVQVGMLLLDLAEFDEAAKVLQQCLTLRAGATQGLVVARRAARCRSR